MPIYEYRCDTNGRTIEVNHPMSATIRTWGELCERADEDPGSTETGAPVEKVVSVPIARSRESSPSGDRGCGPGCGCVV